MSKQILATPHGVTLIAGGPVSARDMAQAVARTRHVVAADGGADRALALGHVPEAVIGDFDSLTDAARARLDPARLHPIAEQDTTDFDKTLRHVQAAFVIGLGCLGGRIDHELAVLNTLVRLGGPCVLLGGQDVVFAAPPGVPLTLDLRVGDRLSLFPLAQVCGQSTGLEWPINGLTFAPDGRIGTSNRVTLRQVQMQFESAGMIVILPRARLDAALAVWSVAKDRRREA